MSEWFPRRPDAQPAEPHTVFVDPTVGEAPERLRWEARAAEWRAVQLAEQVFGGEVGVRLAGRAGSPPFRGLLHLEVPFEDLESHRRREACFLACAREDPVLARVPFVYVLGARAV